MDAGPGTLRQAILDSNATPGTDLINFDITPGGVQTIRPASALPDLSDPVVLDATSQPGFAGRPLIELDGSGRHGRAGRQLERRHADTSG